ncbi:hypothetical protein HPB52_005329 [Rhipicephalus sanguineus]|uniref:ABC transporter n=1 Tax=Rhipicephalus sanguineus TaxID=34632 RepID=A0A9D4PQI0_RHISA|nr:hypothetical protein HPB52_005329 [Rhipicephalus sanguineus]
MGPSGAGKTTLLNILAGHLGLDSSSAQRCVTVLKSLAASGRTVLCSIHNPSARLFSQFDNATCIARLLACLFFAFLLSIMYYDSGNKALQIRETIMMYLVAMMMLLFAYAGANVLTSVCYLIPFSCVCRPTGLFNAQVAVMLCLPAATPSFLFCGFFVRPRHLFPAIRWLTYTSHLYYVHRGIMYALYGNGRGELTCNEWDADVLCVPVEGDAVLDIIDATDVDLLVCSMAVLGIDISLKIFAFALLKWRLQRKQ